ncbi:MAG: hypothetical protein H8E32_13410 [Nitrospinae bacterium]|nr:hypothetical protein [Nitrospinota bacterium]
MKIDIKEDEDTISVLVSVEPLKGKNRSSQKRKIFHKDVLDYLATQNIKVGTCLKNPPLVTNKMGPEQLTGEWVFEKVKPPPPKKTTPIKKKPVQTKKRSKKVKKILDKSPEDVIIYIQEETLPPKEE